MKKFKVKKSVAALGIFTVLLFIAWVVAYAVLAAHFSKYGFLPKHMANVGRMFTFDKARIGPTIFSIIVVVGVIVAIVLSARVSIKKHRKVVWPALCCLFIGAFFVIELFANMTRSEMNYHIGYVFLMKQASTKTLMVVFGLIIVAFLSFVVALAFWIQSMLDATGKLEKEEAEEEITEERIQELVREEVRKALEERPQVIQNFYGLAPEQLVRNQDLEQNVKEQPKEEPKPVKEEPKPAPAPAPVVVEEPEPEEEEEEEGGVKKQIIRIPFPERLVKADKDLKENYNELKNEFLSYGLKSRVSNSGDTFRMHRKAYAKITIAGKGLKIYYPLNPNDYAESPIPVIDVSDKAAYEETPLAFKVKSNLSVRRAKKLLEDSLVGEEIDKLEPGKTDWVKEVRAELREKKAQAK